MLSTSISARQFVCAFIFQNHSVIEAESLKTWMRWGHNRATMRACMSIELCIVRLRNEPVCTGVHDSAHRPADLNFQVLCSSELSQHRRLPAGPDLLLTGTPLQQLMDLNSQTTPLHKQQRNNRQQQQHSREGTKKVNQQLFWLAN